MVKGAVDTFAERPPLPSDWTPTAVQRLRELASEGETYRED